MPSTASVELEKWREDGDRLRFYCHTYGRSQSYSGGTWKDSFDDDRNSSDDAAAAATSCCNVQLRNSLSYHRLPEHLIKLSILKLDGSSFEIQVARSATVEELRLAVEEVFSRLPKEGDDQRDISWSHVWGGFCLCYGNYKLVDDKASLRSFGIKDGDQLRFIRHSSMNFYSPTRRGLIRKRASTISDRHNSTQTVEPEVPLQDGERAKCGGGAEECCHGGDDEDLILGHHECRLAQLLRGWLSYTGLSGATAVGRPLRMPEAKAPTSRLASYCHRIRKTHKFQD